MYILICPSLSPSRYIYLFIYLSSGGGRSCSGKEKQTKECNKKSCIVPGNDYINDRELLPDSEVKRQFSEFLVK